MVLTFHPENQTLIRIAIGPLPHDVQKHESWANYSIMHADRELWNSSGTALDCRKVLSVFPPTNLGKFDRAELTYEIDYKQGVSFRFLIRDRETFDTFNSRLEHPSSIGDYSPEVELITFASPTSVVAEPPIKFIIFPEEGVQMKKAGKSGGQFIRIGSGVQSVFSILGTPDSTFEEFFNYFRLGIDVRILDNSVSDIVMHANVPGHYLFGRYERAWFEFDAGGKKKGGTRIDSTAKINDLVDILGDPGAPIVVDSQPCGLRYCYHFPRSVCAETTLGGIIASLTVSPG
jgi:hypothetical protein